MRSLIVLFAVLAFIFFPGADRAVSLPRAAAPSIITTRNDTSTSSDGTYFVMRVIDGDTVIVTKNGANETVRIIGIDTPEIVDPRKPVQCFGREASEKARSLLTGIQVRLENDATQGEKDKYGRTLAYVFFPDGTDFGGLMIREGYAHEYTYRYPYKYQTQYKEGEREAREAQRGLWSPKACENNLPTSNK